MTPLEIEAAMFSIDGQRGDLNRLAVDAVPSLAKGIYRTRNAIVQAQQKIEQRTIGSLDAEAAAEWLEKNCPDLGQK